MTNTAKTLNTSSILCFFGEVIMRKDVAGIDRTVIVAIGNKYNLTTFFGASYDAGIQAGREAGVQGEAPPVADISIDDLCFSVAIDEISRMNDSAFNKPTFIDASFSFTTPINDFIEPGRYHNSTREPIVLKDEEAWHLYPMDTENSTPLTSFDRREGGENPKRLIKISSYKLPPNKERLDIYPLFRLEKEAATETSEPVNTTSREYKAGVVVGYVEGLADYITAQGLSTVARAVPTDLFAGSVWNMYVRGIALESPGVECGFFDFSSDNPSLVELMSKVQRAQEVMGYSLGFAVRIQREYGVSLNAADIPHDNESHREFMNGLQGMDQERPSPSSLNIKDAYKDPPTYNIPDELISIIQDKLYIERLSPREIANVNADHMYAAGELVRLTGRR